MSLTPIGRSPAAIPPANRSPVAAPAGHSFQRRAPARPTSAQTQSTTEAAALAGLQRIEQQRAAIDRLLERARSGQTFTPEQLLALQARVYQHSFELDVLSRVVDRGVGGLKTLLQMQL